MKRRNRGVAVVDYALVLGVLVLTVTASIRYFRAPVEKPFCGAGSALGKLVQMPNDLGALRASTIGRLAFYDEERQCCAYSAILNQPPQCVDI